MTTRAAQWLVLLLLTAFSSAALADTPAQSDASTPLQQFYNRVRPSVVAVKYQWNGELGRQEVVGCGVVVRDDGLVMVPIFLVYNIIPDAQMKDFKIILPSDTEDETELDADFLGRDERGDIAFIKAKAPRKWTSLQLEDRPLSVGQKVYGVGVLPKSAGYKAYLTEATVSASLRGETPLVLVSGGLANVGSAVFDEDFHAVGIVSPQEGQDVILNGRSELGGLITPPHFFVPSRFYLQSLKDPPTTGKPVQTPWIGVPQMTGVNEQISRFLGIKNEPAVQIGDVVPGAPAAKAGLEPGNIVLKMNGQPLERGDLPEELPMILRRHIIRMNVGDKVTFTVLTFKGAPTKEITMTLEPRPREANEAERFYLQDLGFVAREAVFTDAYEHKMRPDAQGAVVDLVRRDGAGALAKVAMGDWILQLNGTAITTLKEFQREYNVFRHDHPRDPVVLVVQRRTGEEATLNIEPPQSDSLPGAE